MTRNEIDREIVNLASLMNLMINIEKVLGTSKDLKQINDFNIEYSLRYQQLKEKCIELNVILEDYFKSEKEKNNIIDFNLLLAKNQIKQFL